jgi:hypothetical protein
VLLAASLLVGLFATVAQDIVPAAATLAPPESRGRAVGTVMTGLLLGILLSRVVSGFVAEASAGAVFVAAAPASRCWRPCWRAACRASRRPAPCPIRPCCTRWPGCGSSTARCARPPWPRGLLAVGFSAFWSTLAVMLHGAPFHLGSAAAGSFGLAGAVGALAAPYAGRLADSHGPAWVARIAAGLSVLSFASMFADAAAAGRRQLALLAVATVGFDLGVQASLISHQTIVFGIARNRAAA